MNDAPHLLGQHIRKPYALLEDEVLTRAYPVGTHTYDPLCRDCRVVASRPLRVGAVCVIRISTVLTNGPLEGFQCGVMEGRKFSESGIGADPAQPAA